MVLVKRLLAGLATTFLFNHAMINLTATFSGGKDDSSPSCCYLSVMTSTNDEVRHENNSAKT
jgi:hypothetical protein